MEGYILIDSPNFNTIYIYNQKNNKKVLIENINCINFFNNDYVKYNNDTNDIEVLNSDIINGKKIAGILILENNVKYGLNKRKVPYYLFKPLDWKYPNFMVATTHRNRENLYVEIKFNKWERKLPYGMIETIFGPAKDINNLYKSLLSNFSIDTKNLNKKFKNIDIESDDILNRTVLNNLNIITIDPSGCLDMDDAMHFKKISDNLFQIGIHITDVSSYIPINSELDLVAKNRITSVYAPHTVVNMLPDMLSENICSLKENEKRRCISILVKFNSEGSMLDYQILPTLIVVSKNYSYSEFEENKDEELSQFYNFCKLIEIGNIDNKNYDSHKMVEKLMVLGNHLVCHDLIKHKINNVIVRTHPESFNPELEKIPLEIFKDIFFKFMNSAEYKIHTDTSYHSGLNLHEYTHFTSPIRRYADIMVHRLIKSRWNNSEYNFSDDLIDNINYKNKVVKKLDREFKIYQIIDKINKLDVIDGYIVDINSDSKLTIFIPEFKVELKTIIIHKKIKSLFKITEKEEEEDIEIKNLENNTSINLCKYQKIKIKLFEKSNTKYRLDINIIEPNVKDFILSEN